MNKQTKLTSYKLKILQIFAFMLTPLACYQVWMFTSIPNYYLQHVFIYPVIIFCFWAWLNGLLNPRRTAQQYLWLAPILLSVIIVQALSVWQTTSNEGVLLSILKLCAQFVSYIPILLACQVLIEQQHNVYRHLLCGFIFSISLIAVICLIQFIYLNVYIKPQYSALTNVLRKIISFFANFLEAGWESGTNPTYEGSYALFNHRVNGIFEESSALAVNVGVLFIPASFALCFLNKTKKTGFILLLTSIVILIISISLSSLIILCIFFMCSVVSIFKIKIKLKTIVYYLSILIIFLLLLNNYRSITYLVKRYTGDDFTSPRITIFLSALEVAIKNPILGVGRGNFSKHVIATQRYQKNMQYHQELQKWAQRGTLPQLSSFAILLAEYGFIIMALFVSIPAIIWVKLYNLLRNNRTSNNILCVFIGYSTWMTMALTTSLTSIDPRNPMFSVPFFMMALYVKHIRQQFKYPIKL